MTKMHYKIWLYLKVSFKNIITNFNTRYVVMSDYMTVLNYLQLYNSSGCCIFHEVLLCWNCNFSPITITYN